MGFAADDYKLIRERMNPDIFLAPVGAKSGLPNMANLTPVFHYSEEGNIRDGIYHSICDFGASDYKQSLLTNPAFIALVEWAGYKIVEVMKPVRGVEVMHFYVYDVFMKGADGAPGYYMTHFRKQKSSYEIRDPEELAARLKDLENFKNGIY